jgi:hypothetical protein
MSTVCPYCGHTPQEHGEPGCVGCRNAGHDCEWVAPCRYCGDVLPDCRCVRSLRAAESLIAVAPPADQYSGDDGSFDHCGCCAHRRSEGGCGGPDCPCGPKGIE